MTTRNPSRGVSDLDAHIQESLRDADFRGAMEDAEALEDLLDRLVGLRKSAGYTQTIVADRMGTTQSAISDLEGGATDPRVSTLQRYARAVGTRLAINLDFPSVRYEPVASSAFALLARSIAGSIVGCDWTNMNRLIGGYVSEPQTAKPQLALAA